MNNPINLGGIPTIVWLVLICIALILIPVSGIWSGTLGIISIILGLILGAILVLGALGII